MRHPIIAWLSCVLLAAALASGCAGVRIGNRFKIDPLEELKIGHDHKQDVLRKMGNPYRTFVDARGHEVLTYVWADGKGEGHKCLIALNDNDVVYLIEVAP